MGMSWRTVRRDGLLIRRIETIRGKGGTIAPQEMDTECTISLRVETISERVQCALTFESGG